MSDQNASQRIQKLNSQQNSVNNKIIQYQTELKSVSEQLSDAWAEIKELYGVDNLDDLRALYKKKSDERDLKLNNAEKELSEIGSILNMIDKSLSELKG